MRLGLRDVSSFLSVTLAVAFVSACFPGIVSVLSAAEVFSFYIGTYTQGAAGGRGIYLAAFDERDGTFKDAELVYECDSPAFLAGSPGPDRPFLYAVGETWDSGGASVHALTIDSETKSLRKNNRRTVPGSGPTHLCVCDVDGRETLVVACYGSGETVSFPIDADGKLREMADRIVHRGSGPNSARQNEPHPHGAYFLPSQKSVFVPDLGVDRIFRFELDPETSRLVERERIVTPSGSGPRHLDFASERRFYVVNELDSTVSCVQKDPASRRWEIVQTVSTVPQGIPGVSAGAEQSRNTTAEISVHKSGRFAYASNRGRDSIAVFSVTQDSGELTLIHNEPTRGKTPRHFALTPSGRHLLVANQDSGTIFAFAVDADTGRLSPLEKGIEVASPACILFIP